MNGEKSMKTQKDIKDSAQQKQYEDLIARAIRKLPDAYAPYSKFHVAAALLAADGSVTEGVNVENATYPAGICAERTAIFWAVSNGCRSFRAIVIVGCHEEWLEKDAFCNLQLPAYCPPCGICRQVMREFADPEKFEVILAKTPQDYKVYKLAELLPESFGPENL